MAIINIANSFQLIGRIVKEPNIVEHNDGSMSVTIMMAVKNNFRTTKENVKDYHSNLLSIRKFIPVKNKEQQLNIYKHLEVGDLIGINGHLESYIYENEGNSKYIQTNVIDEINTTLETKIAKKDRLERKKQKENGGITTELAPETDLLDDKTKDDEELLYPFGR